VLSHDLENDPDVIAMIGASAALTISGIPFMGPSRRPAWVCRRAIHLETRFQEKLPESALDLIVAGTAEGVLMVESEAKELSRGTSLLGAVTFGFEQIPAGDPGDHRIWPRPAPRSPGHAAPASESRSPVAKRFG